MVRRAAMALPASMALPPPIAITEPHSSRRACSTPGADQVDCRFARDGKERARKIRHEGPNAGWIRARDYERASAIESGDCGQAARFAFAENNPRGGGEFKMHFFKNAFSKCVVGRIHVAVDGTRARLGEHIRGAFGPYVIVRRLAMRGVAGLIAIDLHQYELAGSRCLLDQVEPHASRLPKTGGCVLDGCCDEIVDALGLDLDVNVKNMHIRRNRPGRPTFGKSGS